MHLIPRNRCGCSQPRPSFPYSSNIVVFSGVITVLLHWGPSWSWRSVFDTTLCDIACKCLWAGWWFSPVTAVSSTNKTDHHDITEILLKVASNTITLSRNRCPLLDVTLCSIKSAKYFHFC